MSEEVEKVTVVCKNRETYVKARTAAGKTSLNCGDEVASMLAGLTLDDVYDIADTALNLKAAELKEMYAKLNDGMQKMTLSNRIRGAVNKDAKLEDGGALLGELQAIAEELKPEVVEEDEAA